MSRPNQKGKQKKKHQNDGSDTIFGFRENCEKHHFDSSGKETSYQPCLLCKIAAQEYNRLSMAATANVIAEARQRREEAQLRQAVYVHRLACSSPDFWVEYFEQDVLQGTILRFDFRMAQALVYTFKRLSSCKPKEKYIQREIMALEKEAEEADNYMKKFRESGEDAVITLQVFARMVIAKARVRRLHLERRSKQNEGEWEWESIPRYS